MKPRGAVNIGENVLGWTGKPSSICWVCALKQQRQRNHTGTAARFQDGGPRIRKFDSWSKQQLFLGSTPPTEPSVVRKHFAIARSPEENIFTEWTVKARRLANKEHGIEQESKERLNAALHYWTTEREPSIGQQLSVSPSSDASGVTKSRGSNWDSGAVARSSNFISIRRVPSLQRNRHALPDLRSMSAGAQRAIHSTGAVGDHCSWRLDR